MDTLTKAHTLLAYLDTLANFDIEEQVEGMYDHMGATIADAILQAGTSYATVVKPRVNAILQNYPKENTTSYFLKLLVSEGAKAVLNWRDDEKPNRVLALTRFLIGEGIETEKDLLHWIAQEENLEKIQGVRGVGPKTADYLRILVGYQTTVVDRYVYRLIEEAGLGKLQYEEARDVLDVAADTRGVPRASFDYSIWLFMSKRGKEY